MSEVRINHDIESIKAQYELLLENFSKLSMKVRPRTKVSSTKLGLIKKNLNKIESLDKETLIKTIEIVTKYNSINEIFSNNIKCNESDLFKLLEGSANPETERNEKYNDFFFEFSMACRFLRVLPKDEEINVDLAGVCDIVVNDFFAVECKYIHSQSGISENISKANKQIATRIKDGQAEVGFIALDLSNLIPRAKIEDFVNFTLQRFIKGYKRLEAKKYISGDLIRHILCDKNFSQIISHYSTFEIESIVREEIGFADQFEDGMIAILLQSINTFLIEDGNQLIPFSTRSLTYIVNPNLPRENLLGVKQFINKLAVGF